jgi:hypothetical protein
MIIAPLQTEGSISSSGFVLSSAAADWCKLRSEWRWNPSVVIASPSEAQAPYVVDQLKTQFNSIQYSIRVRAGPWGPYTYIQCE